MSCPDRGEQRSCTSGGGREVRWCRDTGMVLWHAPDGTWKVLDSGGPPPRRIQLSRRRGWRKPADAVVVARPTKWGNPYRVTEHGRLRAVDLYRQHLRTRPELVDAAREELAGKPLACWCPLDGPCHADVLIEVASGGTP